MRRSGRAIEARSEAWHARRGPAQRNVARLPVSTPMFLSLAMSDSPTRRPSLQPVSAGMDRLAALFAPDVRARARGYVCGENIQVLENNGEVLLAAVSGADRYLSAFRRTKRGIYYGCTCPFFAEGLAGCKHLWALVRAADPSELVRHAEECTTNSWQRPPSYTGYRTNERKHRPQTPKTRSRSPPSSRDRSCARAPSPSPGGQHDRIRVAARPERANLVVCDSCASAGAT